jgi:tetratricopeptide (TPR) repeat protein
MSFGLRTIELISCVFLAAFLAGAQEKKMGERDLQIQKLPEPAGAGLKEVKVPRGYALVIGVGKYKNLDSRDYLRFSESDAEAVKRVLLSMQGGNIAPQNVHELIGPQATLQNIRRELEEWLPSVAKEEDRVIVYYSGHGLVKGNRGFISPYDVNPADPEKTAYPMDLVGNVLANKVKARWKVLLADACHSGKITAESTVDAVNTAFTKMPLTFLTFTASREQESSYEDPNLGSGFGLFSYFLVQGWEGNADVSPRDGVVTADELVEYVRREVKDYARRRGRMQTPTERGDFDPEMIVGYSPVRRAAAHSQPLPDGSLVIEANMDGVEIYLDDRLVGTIGKDKKLPLPGISSGIHVIKGVKMGYDPDTKEVMVVPGQEKTVTIRIQFARQRKKSAKILFDEGVGVYTKRKSEGDLRKAADLFTRALAEDEKYSEAAMYLCLTDQILSETDAALHACKKAIDIDPDYVDARVYYGGLLFESGDTDEAIRQLNVALQQNPRNSLAYSFLAQAYRTTGTYDKAIDMANRAIQLDSGQSQAYLWRADSQRLLGHFAEARDDYKAYLELDNFTAPLHEKLAFYLIGFGMSKRNASQKLVYARQRNGAFFGLCDCEQRLGNLTGARQYCEKALQYEASDPYALLVLGNIHAKLFNRTQRSEDLLTAKRYYSEVIAINPDQKEAQEARSYIDQIDKILPRVAK